MLIRLSSTTSSENTTRRTIQSVCLFQGRKTKCLLPKRDDGNDAKDAKTFASELEGPKSNGSFQEEHIMAEQSNDHEFMLKDGKLWANALEACAVSARKPICKCWGKYLYGSGKKS